MNIIRHVKALGIGGVMRRPKNTEWLQEDIEDESTVELRRALHCPHVQRDEPLYLAIQDELAVRCAFASARTKLGSGPHRNLFCDAGVQGGLRGGTDAFS